MTSAVTKVHSQAKEEGIEEAVESVSCPGRMTEYLLKRLYEVGHIV